MFFRSWFQGLAVFPGHGTVQQGNLFTEQNQICYMYSGQSTLDLADEQDKQKVNNFKNNQ